MRAGSGRPRPLKHIPDQAGDSGVKWPTRCFCRQRKTKNVHHCARLVASSPKIFEFPEAQSQAPAGAGSTAALILLRWKILTFDLGVSSQRGKKIGTLKKCVESQCQPYTSELQKWVKVEGTPNTDKPSKKRVLYFTLNTNNVLKNLEAVAIIACLGSKLLVFVYVAQRESLTTD
jgi:hypothetical protein